MYSVLIQILGVQASDTTKPPKTKQAERDLYTGLVENRKSQLLHLIQFGQPGSIPARI